VSSSKALADSLDGAERGDDKYFNTLVRMMATRYVCGEGWGGGQGGGAAACIGTLLHVLDVIGVMTNTSTHSHDGDQVLYMKRG
jgi:hypothetical protein